jgi:glycosidase
MGVWQISPGARKISKIVSEDFEGSPYAIPDYKINKGLGGKKQFEELVERAHRAGLSVILDFVSNHMAIDSPWIGEDPDLFITSNPRVRNQATSEYFLHPSGEIVAFGRDPFFPPWHDTSQLDYTCEELRARMTSVLKRISKYADGVRCDMAMLVMRDYIRRQWYPLADESWFNRAMPGEFWDRATAEVKRLRPDFSFIAEAYWHKEEELVRLGFDLAYEKELYDALVGRNADQVKNRISRPPEALASSLFFIENHDEPRAASVLNTENNLASAALILTMPGSVLIHEGQMEGFTEKLPVQRLKPVQAQIVDPKLRDSYQQLLLVTRDPVFAQGRLTLLETGIYGVVSFARSNSHRVVAYVGQISDAWHKFSLVALNVTDLAKLVGATNRMRLTNLITRESVTLERISDIFTVQLNQLGLAEQDRHCLLEAAPA